MLPGMGGAFTKVFGWVMGIDVGSIAKSVTHTIEVKAEAQASTAIAAINANKDTANLAESAKMQIVLANVRADMAQTDLQSKLAAADRADWRTAWMRPAGFAIAVWYLGCGVFTHTMPELSASLGIVWTPLPDPYGWVVLAIVGAIYVFRTKEKTAAAETRAQIITAHTATHPLAARLPAFLPPPPGDRQ